MHMRQVTSDGDEDDNEIDDIVKRLTCVSEGCETQELVVVKNLAGNTSLVSWSHTLSHTTHGVKS